MTKVEEIINRWAQTTKDTAQNILSAELDHVSQVAAVSVPSLSTMRRNMRHANEDRNISENPLNRAGVPVIPKE